MESVKVRVGKNFSIKVVNSSEQKDYISNHDIEMDSRAVEAVRTAVKKAEFCQKPIARYDPDAQKVYVEYANGERKYVD